MLSCAAGRLRVVRPCSVLSAHVAFVSVISFCRSLTCLQMIVLIVDSVSENSRPCPEQSADDN